MSKEMTPKDALQMIQDNLTPRVLGILTVEFNVVKKALERLELLEKENQELETDKKILNALYQEVKDTASFYMSKCEKLKKAIEILKDKAGIKIKKISDMFLIYAYVVAGPLTQQEYDLLKEVFG